MTEEEIYRGVMEKLTALGFAEGLDSGLIRYSVSLTGERIRAEINCSEIPEGLRFTWIEMAAGQGLSTLRAAGLLPEIDEASAASAKSISEGDVTVQFAGASEGVLTPAARLDKLIGAMLHPDPGIFAAFRRLVW